MDTNKNEINSDTNKNEINSDDTKNNDINLDDTNKNKINSDTNKNEINLDTNKNEINLNVTEWTKLRNEDVHGLCSWPFSATLLLFVITVINSRRIEIINACRAWRKR